MTARKSFVYYTDWAKDLLALPDELRLKIDDAVKKYVLYGEEPTDREVLYSLFASMRRRLDEDGEKYEKVCATRRDAGKKGAKVRYSKCQQLVANANKRWQNKLDNDNVSTLVDIKESISIDIPKKKVSLKQSLEARKKEFKDSLTPFVETYGADMINDFFEYWTEPNKSGRRMRYELEKTWDISRRLSRWSTNNYNGKNYGR